MLLPIRALLPLLAMLALPIAGFCQTPVTLDEVVTWTLDNNPRLQSQRTRAQAEATDALAAFALPDPTFGVTVSPTPMHTARGTQRSMWRLEQRLPYPGTRALRAAAAEDMARSVSGLADAMSVDLARQASRLYMEWAGAEEKLRQTGEYIRLVQGFEDAAATQYELGTGQQQAILKAQIEKNRLRRRVITLEAQRTHLTALLDALVGGALPDQAVASLPPVPPPAGPRATDIAQPVGPATDQDPETARLEALRRRAATMERLVLRERRPDFALSLQYTDIAKASTPPTADGRDAVAFGVGVRLPIWNQGRNANRQRLQLEQRALEQAIQDRQQTLRAQIEAVQARIQGERAALELISGTLIPQASTALAATTSAYTNGSTQFLDLLDAERTRFDLELDRIDTHVRLLQELAELDALLATHLGGAQQ